MVSDRVEHYRLMTYLSSDPIALAFNLSEAADLINSLEKQIKLYRALHKAADLQHDPSVELCKALEALDAD